jgi:hypothetical protein
MEVPIMRRSYEKKIYNLAVDMAVLSIYVRLTGDFKEDEE